MHFINGNTGWAASSNFNLRRTTNGGLNWITLQSFPNSIGDIFFVDANTGWLNGGDSSGLLKTINGGLNWTNQILPSGSFGFGGIFMLNVNTGWVGGTGNQIHKTTNGGINWILYTGMPIFQPTEICFVDSLTGWCAKAGLAKTTNGGIMYINQTGNEIPRFYTLLQNYPNPFNPYTTIKFKVSNRSFILLKVFDLLGREMTTLVNQVLNTGVYETGFDGGSLPSGTYFYRLIADGDIINTKKMVLVK